MFHSHEVFSRACDWLSRGVTFPGKGVEFHLAKTFSLFFFFFLRRLSQLRERNVKVEPEHIIIRLSLYGRLPWRPHKIYLSSARTAYLGNLCECLWLCVFVFFELTSAPQAADFCGSALFSNISNARLGFNSFPPVQTRVHTHTCSRSPDLSTAAYATLVTSHTGLTSTND